MTGVIRETHKVNARALELGLEPPVCVTWEVESYPVDDDGHHDVHLGRPSQSVDSARLAAFMHMMYEIGES